MKDAWTPLAWSVNRSKSYMRCCTYEDAHKSTSGIAGRTTRTTLQSNANVENDPYVFPQMTCFKGKKVVATQEITRPSGSVALKVLQKSFT